MSLPVLSDSVDTRGRPVRDLRISVTDRCNFRCQYCMPREVFGPDYPFLERADLLSFEEIARVARMFADFGVRKIRLTGGEPLLRRDLSNLVSMLSTVPGVEIALTTNATLLAQQAAELKEAGLDRVTVSLDSLDEAIFEQMNDARFPVADVLAAIDRAAEVGLRPIKINCVVRRGVNDRTVVDLARYFRGTEHIVRFIEFMDVGTTNGWRLEEVVPGREILEMIGAEFPLEPVDPDYRGEVSRRWRYKDGAGEIGVITSVTDPFCGDCTRARLSAKGELFTCLFAESGHDLRAALRRPATDDELRSLIASVWSNRDDRYSEVRSEATEDLKRIRSDGGSEADRDVVHRGLKPRRAAVQATLAPYRRGGAAGARRPSPEWSAGLPASGPLR